MALLLGWRGGFAPNPWTDRPVAPSIEALVNLSPEVASRASSNARFNARFNAYRADTLARLEQEQDKFDMFLGRLRQAKDKSEFDDFLDERATRSTPINGLPPQK